eukprot:gene6898-7114_t
MGSACGKHQQVSDREADLQQSSQQHDTCGNVSKKRTDCKVKDAYRLGKTLGTGGFAIVKLATDKKSGEQFAVKIMTLPSSSTEPGDNENTREDIFKEIDILCGLNHENVVYLKEYFEEGNKVYLITELVTGGELLEAVLQRGSYSESEARLAFVQLLKGIQYLHSKNVVHRDLKLENLLLASPAEITNVKIADFGLAKQSADAMSTVCGTPQYVAPEVIQGGNNTEYGPEVDMWSAGVVLFILLGGYPPFWNENEPALFEQIRRGQYSFDDPVWDALDSNPGADLLLTALSMRAPEFASAMAAAQAYEEQVAVRSYLRTYRRQRGAAAVTAPLSDAVSAFIASKNLSAVDTAGILSKIDTYIVQEYAADPQDLNLLLFDDDNDISGDDSVPLTGYSAVFASLLQNLSSSIRFNSEVTKIALNGSSNAKAFKVVMQFRTAFWINKAGAVPWIGRLATEPQLPTEFFSLFDTTKQPILVAFYAGRAAVAAEKRTDADVLASATSALKTMFGSFYQEPIRYLVTRWAQDPYSLGSYSIVKPGAAAKGARSQLGQPEANSRLFFAGEAVNQAYPATVQGAWLSGMKAAADLLAAYKRTARRTAAVQAATGATYSFLGEGNGAK